MSPGFDNQLYLEKQTQGILQRIKRFPDKLYLEFGGKILYDLHAARVLPGFKPRAKLEILKKLKNQVEIIICVSVPDIERKKERSDFNLTYDDYVLKMYDEFKKEKLGKPQVVITRFKPNTNQPVTETFINKLKKRKIKFYIHHFIKGYPEKIDLVLSQQGFGKNPYIKTEKQLVIVTAPGPGSGKLATCLNQLYHEHQKGVNAGYAKFETFPIWNLSLKHPVNLAYEAATTDIGDYNLIDPFHLKKYRRKVVNYNRDVDVFPILKKILKHIFKKDIYHSPTDMGVNQTGLAITDDSIVRQAAEKEIKRRKAIREEQPRGK